MAHFINPVEEEHCVFLTFEGELAPLEIVSTRYEINELLETKQWSRLVMDITSLTARQTTVLLLDFAGGVFTGVPHNARIAVIVRPEQAELARIRGQTPRDHGVTIAVFLDELSATGWVEELDPENRQQQDAICPNHASEENHQP
jgi:hypothetical protein